MLTTWLIYATFYGVILAVTMGTSPTFPEAPEMSGVAPFVELDWWVNQALLSERIIKPGKLIEVTPAELAAHPGFKNLNGFPYKVFKLDCRVTGYPKESLGAYYVRINGWFLNCEEMGLRTRETCYNPCPTGLSGKIGLARKGSRYDIHGYYTRRSRSLTTRMKPVWIAREKSTFGSHHGDPALYEVFKAEQGLGPEDLLDPRVPKSEQRSTIEWDAYLSIRETYRTSLTNRVGPASEEEARLANLWFPTNGEVQHMLDKSFELNSPPSPPEDRRGSGLDDGWDF